MQTIPRRALGLVAVLGLALGACTATVPDAAGPAPAGSDTVTAADAGGNGTGAAPSRVRLLDMADVSAALETTDDVEVHVDVAVDVPGATMPAMRFTTTSDATSGRFSYRSEPVEFADTTGAGSTLTVPGHEMIGQATDDGMDLYLRADGDDGWTRLVVDESLVGETDVFRDPGTILDSFEVTDMPGLVFTEDGTGTHAGQTMTRQVATLDLIAMFDEAVGQGAFDDADGFTDLMGDLFDDEDLDAFLPGGTIELLVDDDATPRRIDIDLSMGAAFGTGDTAGSMRTTITIDPAPGGGIAVPSDEDVTETVTVETPADLVDALGDLSGALDWN